MLDITHLGQGGARLTDAEVVLRAGDAKSAESNTARVAPSLRSGGFEFVAGEENRTAAWAVGRLLALAASDVHTPLTAPGVVDERAKHDDAAALLSPLVLYGASGVGKSHLCEALASGWRKLRPADAVLHLAGSEFAERYAAAVDADAIVAFQRRVRDVDLFIVEDLAKLAKKQPAQWELLQTIDALENRGAVVVLSLDAAPSKVDGLLPGLISRLTAGLVIEVVSPSAASRRVILTQVTEQRGWSIPRRALELLAADLEATVPELIGTLATIEATCHSEGVKLDAAAVRRFLDRRSAAHAPSLKAIAEQSARRFGLTSADLKSGSRRRSVVMARDAAVFLARRLTNKSLQEIGEFFGGRDHTTIMHSYGKVEAAVVRDPTTRETLDAIRGKLAKA